MYFTAYNMFIFVPVLQVIVFKRAISVVRTFADRNFFFTFFFLVVNFSVASTLLRLYGNFPALLVEVAFRALFLARAGT